MVEIEGDENNKEGGEDVKKKLVGIMIILAMTFSVVQPIQMGELTQVSQAKLSVYTMKIAKVRKLYDKIKNDMSYKKVKKLLKHKHSSIVETTEFDNEPIIEYQWTFSPSSSSATIININVRFLGNKVVSKQYTQIF